MVRVRHDCDQQVEDDLHDDHEPLEDEDDLPVELEPRASNAAYSPMLKVVYRV